MTTIAELVAKLSVEGVGTAQKEIKSFNRSFDDAGKAVSRVNKVLGAFGVALGARAIVQGVTNLVALGAQAETVGDSFENLARATGMASDAMLTSLRAASRGAISDMQLMQAANKAMIMGGEQMGQALPRLLELARSAALATGEDMQYMFNSIVTGIARQSPLILDNLGLIVDMPSAYKAYADSIGKSVTKLSEQEKMTALLNDVLRVAPDYIKKVGAEGTTSAEKIAGITSAWQDLKTETGEALLLKIEVLFLGKWLRDTADAQAAVNEISDALANVKDPKARKEFEIRSVSIGLKQQPLNGERIEWTAERQAQEYARLTREIALYVKRQDEAADRIQKIEQAAHKSWVSFLRAEKYGKDFNIVLREMADEAGNAAWSLRLAAQAASLMDKATVGTDTTPWWVMSGVPRPKTAGETALRTSQLLEAYDAWEEYENSRARASESAASRASSAWQRTYSEAQSMAQSALSARMSPTGGDFLSTALGTYQNAPLESVRRLDAVIARGFSELQAHPDWAALLKIPDDVLGGSELALKAWASQTRDAAANLARPDLIDWDAFLGEFQRMQQEQAGKQMTMDIAMGKIKAAGLMGNDAQTKQTLLQMFGLDTPETQAQALGEAMTRAFSASDPAGIYVKQFDTGLQQRQRETDFIAKKLREMTQPDGKAAAQKFIDDYRKEIMAVADPAFGMTPPVGGGYVLP